MLGGMADAMILKMKECRHGNQWKATITTSRKQRRLATTDIMQMQIVGRPSHLLSLNMLIGQLTVAWPKVLEAVSCYLWWPTRILNTAGRSRRSTN